MVDVLGNNVSLTLTMKRLKGFYQDLYTRPTLCDIVHVQHCISMCIITDLRSGHAMYFTVWSW